MGCRNSIDPLAYFILLTGTGAFSVARIAEKALLEARRRFAVYRFLVEGLVVLFVASHTKKHFEGPISSGLAVAYPWASSPSELLPLLSIGLLFGYISVTLASALSLVWRKRTANAWATYTFYQKSISQELTTGAFNIPTGENRSISGREVRMCQTGRT